MYDRLKVRKAFAKIKANACDIPELNQIAYERKFSDSQFVMDEIMIKEISSKNPDDLESCWSQDLANINEAQTEVEAWDAVSDNDKKLTNEDKDMFCEGYIRALKKHDINSKNPWTDYNPD